MSWKGVITLIGNVQPPEHIVPDKPDDKAAVVTKNEPEKTTDNETFRDIFLRKMTKKE